MDMRLLALLALLTVTACDGERRSHQNYDWVDTEMTADGITVRYTEDAARINPSAIDEAYRAVVECVGYAPGVMPTIGLVPEMDGLNDDEDVEGTIDESGFIVVESPEDEYEILSIAVLQHEFIHYVMIRAGITLAAQRDHRQAAFDDDDGCEHPFY